MSMNINSNTMHSNFVQLQQQREALNEGVTNNADLAEKQQTTSGNNSNSTFSVSKKDDAGLATQLANSDIKDSSKASQSMNAQNNLLEKINKQKESIEGGDLSAEEKQEAQNNINEMIKSYDNIAKNSGGSSYESSIKNSDETGKTRVESTEAIKQSGTATVTLQDKDGNDISVESNLDSSDMKKSLEDLAKKINEESDKTGVNANVVYDDKTGEGKLVMSKEGDESIDYSMEVKSDDGTSISIKSEASTTFSLSDLSSENQLNEEQAKVLGVDKDSSLLDSELGSSITSSVLDNAKNDIQSTQSNQDDYIQQIKQMATDMLSQMRNGNNTTLSNLFNLNSYDFANESSNFTKQNVLMQSGSSVLAQANASPQNVLKLLQ